MTYKFTESVVEEACLDYFGRLGYAYLPAPEIACDGLFAEREGYGEAVLKRRLRTALIRINPKIPPAAIEDAVRKAVRTDSPTLVVNNRAFHSMLVNGIPVECREPAPSPLAPLPGGEGKPTPSPPAPLPRGEGGQYRGGFRFAGLTARAREMRENATPAEAVLWECLRSGRLEGLKFRRQHQIGDYIVDFYCHERRLVVEVDGPVHEEERRHHVDAVRDAYLRSQGNAVLRFSNAEVLDSTHAVLEAIANSLPSPAGRGVGGEGSLRYETVRLIDFDNPEANDWLVVNQFTVVENHVTRRPDLVVFVNGLPLAVVELKNPADAQATVRGAYNQFQTYKAQVPCLFTANALLVISDGHEAKVGSLTADWERFSPWRTIDGTDLGGPSRQPSPRPDGRPSPMGRGAGNEGSRRPDGPPSPNGRGAGGEGHKDFKCGLEVLVLGVFEKRRLLDLVRSFIVFEEDAGVIVKKLAGYHQFHAVRLAVEETVRASSPKGDKRIGVVWHTQGSGKSLSMIFFASKIILHPKMENPTIVVLTDRNDLDDQLFRTFSLGKDLLRQTPRQATDRDHLKELLKVSSGGVVFTTAQKFAPEKGERRYPLLSDRRNIVVIADEAHRSQYDFLDGFARHIRDGLPKASFIGFTGTPIELNDRNTTAVFGDYISIYDIERAVEDKTTVKIYYEGRLAKLELAESEKPKIDPDFEEITETEEADEKSELKRKWSRLEAMVGTEKRLALVARDIVDHFERRQEAMDGKAMVVCMSRRICVDLYDQIVRLRPEWHSPDFGKGAIKVVMTGSAADPERYASHLMTPKVRKDIENRFKKPEDPLKIVIVRDMWLTGFDVPCLHTMYLDKPMQGHGLMQAIARVNRVFKDKPGGLIVDYLGIAEELKEAVAQYTQSGGKGRPAYDQQVAVTLMLEKYEVVKGIFNPFDWTPFLSGSAAERLACLSAGVEFVLGLEDGRQRVLANVRLLTEAFALSVPDEKALAIREDVAFFQAVRSQLVKLGGGGGGSDDGEGEKDVDRAVKQLVARSVASNEVIDIFRAVGLDKPDISILSEEFLAEVQKMPQKNLAVEVFRKLMKDAIIRQARTNLVQSRNFSEMLEETIRKYQNRTIEVAQVIAELVQIAKRFKQAMGRGEELGLNDAELAFYDSLETNDSAVMELGDDTLKAIARDLVTAVRKSVTIDWTLKDSVRAKIRTMVKRILRKYDYPPDKQEKATQTVLEQAELLCGDWAERDV